MPFEYSYLLLAIPAVIGILISLWAGGITYKRVMVAAAQIVVKLANEPLKNQEKRAVAVRLLYQKFPKLGTVVPESYAGKFVDFVWEEVIKPAALLPLPAAKEKTPADPADKG